MKKISTSVFILVLAVTSALALFSPVQAQSTPPINPDAEWQPPDESTESISPSVGVEAYNQNYPNLQMAPALGVPAGLTGTITAAYLVNSYGQVLSTLHGNEICYLVVSLNGPGYLYLWEYYPAGSTPYGHWLVYRWYRSSAGIWRIGPFQANAWDANGRYTWKIWYQSGGYFSSRSLSFNYTRGYYLPGAIDPISQAVYTPVINSFTSNLSTIDQGQTATLTWSTSNASTVNITPGVGPVAASGSITVNPSATTTYVLTATGNSGSTVTNSTTINVTPRVAPVFSVSLSNIQSGQQATLTWNAPSATLVTISDVGTFSSAGSTQVTPDETTTYTLTATYVDGATQAASVTVNVEQPPYLLYGLIGLLAIGAIVITVLLATRPKAAAQIRESAGTRAATAPAPTEAASESHATRTAEIPPAKLTMPDGSELLLAGNNRSLGRQDFDKYLSPEKRAFLSRQHVNIWYEDGNYYIEDRSSTNGTRLNGIDIKGDGRQALEDGDVIELAGKLSITFKKQP